MCREEIMLYLVSAIWFWLLAVFVVSFIVGWSVAARNEREG